MFKLLIDLRLQLKTWKHWTVVLSNNLRKTPCNNSNLVIVSDWLQDPSHCVLERCEIFIHCTQWMRVAQYIVNWMEFNMYAVRCQFIGSETNYLSAIQKVHGSIPCTAVMNAHFRGVFYYSITVIQCFWFFYYWSSKMS